MSEVIIEKKQNENQITVKEDKLQVMIIDKTKEDCTNEHIVIDNQQIKSVSLLNFGNSNKRQIEV